MKTKIYKIELIEFYGVYFPRRVTYKVEAQNLDDALLRVFNKLELKSGFVNPAEIEALKWETVSEFGYNKNCNECIALAYNRLLDVCDEYMRLIRGYVNNRRCFDITIEDEISLIKGA